MSTQVEATKNEKIESQPVAENNKSNEVVEDSAMITKFRLKRQQQKSAQVFLQSQYPKSKQIADVVVACLWTGFAIRLYSKIIWSLLGSPIEIIHLLIYIASAALLADFVSGMIHWACDTYGTLQTPVFGKTLIRSFREHHVDPTAITKHPFAETCGNSFIVTLPWVVIASFFDISGSPILVFGSVAAFWLAFTNQIHKFAHTYNPPAVIKYLQKSRIILQGKTHNYHHFSPYDRDYCITTGWLNPIFLRLDLWKKMEQIIFDHTGTKPREDDKHWTFQDAVAPKQEEEKKQI
eukprot:TRINITY_DN293_c0_g1_i1.p1 TRINITY_DN293_c0_g1~~TRINITY_DN293_c0_g1_i1.p1  ORF type:complete len:293 (-),score=40.35 TRINITY_DN293_c0_g1_i1:206-1084(-)